MNNGVSLNPGALTRAISLFTNASYFLPSKQISKLVVLISGI
jgi:hypothetical protein